MVSFAITLIPKFFYCIILMHPEGERTSGSLLLRLRDGKFFEVFYRHYTLSQFWR
jgi:hypothetical protein